MEIERVSRLWKKENGAAAGGTTEPELGPQQTSAVAGLTEWIRARLRYLRQELTGRVAQARITETDAEIKLEMDLPGVEPRAVEVEIDQGCAVRVRATRVEERERHAPGYRRVERIERVIRRAVRLGLPVDGESAKLALQNGVLSLKVRRAAQATGLPKEIRLTAAP